MIVALGTAFLIKRNVTACHEIQRDVIAFLLNQRCFKSMGFFKSLRLFNHPDVEFLIQSSPFYLLNIPLDEVVALYLALTFLVLQSLYVFFI